MTLSKFGLSLLKERVDTYEFTGKIAGSIRDEGNIVQRAFLRGPR